jgi:hypothetical protein
VGPESESDDDVGVDEEEEENKQTKQTKAKKHGCGDVSAIRNTIPASGMPTVMVTIGGTKQKTPKKYEFFHLLDVEDSSAVQYGGVIGDQEMDDIECVAMALDSKSSRAKVGGNRHHFNVE